MVMDIRYSNAMDKSRRGIGTLNSYSCARKGFWISSEPSVGLMRVIVGPLNTAKPSFLLLSWTSAYGPELRTRRQARK